ncbi:MAG TPA: 16S rRNA (cytidine(1402)-2'-O)-methyltransferase [Actinomycetota bacterium]|nr:16S rRNA (cytidine(1402)-2'-O)-methyltransferase [Actinomycetota bacterium]
MTGTLYVVGTPIGNLEDLSPRAARTLAAASLVAAEDTRRTGRLLAGLGIGVPMVSVFAGNEASRVPRILAALAEGDVALVSDGGMPLVSDPGWRVVRAAVDAGFDVRVVPGPSAAVAALVASGLTSDRWAFEGFLPRRSGERDRRLAELATDPRTVVLFESPKRTGATLAAIAGICGADRPVAVCRELTKLHETIVRGPAGEVAASIGELRGEVVIVVGGADAVPAGDLDAAVADARDAIAAGTKPREAARRAASAHGVTANDVYGRLTGGDPT